MHKLFSTRFTEDSHKPRFDDYVNDKDCVSIVNELDLYLDEKVILRMEDFNILGRWKKILIGIIYWLESLEIFWGF